MLLVFPCASSSLILSPAFFSLTLITTSSSLSCWRTLLTVCSWAMLWHRYGMNKRFTKEPELCFFFLQQTTYCQMFWEKGIYLSKHVYAFRYRNIQIFKHIHSNNHIHSVRFVLWWWQPLSQCGICDYGPTHLIHTHINPNQLSLLLVTRTLP